MMSSVRVSRKILLRPSAIQLLRLVATLLPLCARATLTINAVDMESGQMGAAGTTCVETDNFSLYQESYFRAIGKSVLQAQGLLSSEDDPHIVLALELMENNTPPEDIIAAITNPEIDNGTFDVANLTVANADIRQYGLVNLMTGQAAGYTGSKFDELYTFFGFVPSFNQDRQGVNGGSYSFSSQGNVVSNNTVDILATTFESSMGCDLADKLFLALDEVAKQGEGDVRCTVPYGFPGFSAFLKVEDANGDDVILIEVPTEVPGNPIMALRNQYDAWRTANPCATSGGNTTTTTTSAAVSTSSWGKDKLFQFLLGMLAVSAAAAGSVVSITI